jgi:hypothetical protein
MSTVSVEQTTLSSLTRELLVLMGHVPRGFSAATLGFCELGGRETGVGRERAGVEGGGT